MSILSGAPDGVVARDVAVEQPRRAAAIAALISAVLTAALYLIGAERTLDYDGSVTVANFVRTPSLLDPFRRQVVFNNHLGFSFLEHLIVDITGSSDEWVLRLLPILVGALAVGLLVHAASTRWGLAVGVTAGGLLATNPMFVTTTREVRGYSLLVLGTVASTLLMLQLAERRSRALSVAYVLVIGATIVVHFYAVFVVGAHIVWRAAHGDAGREWWARWLSAVAIAAVAYLGIVGQMIETRGERGARFQPGFPRALLWELLGATAIVVVISAVGVVLALRVVLRSSACRALTAYLASIVLAIWVLSPRDLFPRFFIWLLPLLAVTAAWGLWSLRPRTPAPVVTVLAVMAVMSAAVAASSGYAREPLATRAMAPYIRTLQRNGARVCGLGDAAETLPAYVSGVEQVAAADIEGCDALAVVNRDRDRAGVRAARQDLPNVAEFPAGTTAVLLTSDRWASTIRR